MSDILSQKDFGVSIDNIDVALGKLQEIFDKERGI